MERGLIILCDRSDVLSRLAILELVRFLPEVVVYDDSHEVSCEDLSKKLMQIGVFPICVREISVPTFEYVRKLEVVYRPPEYEVVRKSTKPSVPNFLKSTNCARKSGKRGK